MSKNSLSAFDKKSLPPLPLSPPPSPPRETLMHGRRQHDLTIVTFDLKSSGGFDDTLTINIDDLRVKTPGSITVRGKWEVSEMVSHFRWLAEVLAQQGENKNPATQEYVTCQKSLGGAA